MMAQMRTQWSECSAVKCVDLELIAHMKVLGLIAHIISCAQHTQLVCSTYTSCGAVWNECNAV